MRVVCQQLAPKVGENTANRNAALSAISRSVDLGADLIILPELCTSGYVFESKEEVVAASISLDSPALEAWCQALRDTDSILIAGIPLREGQETFNAAVALNSAGVVEVYRKTHLWDREKLWFQPGTQRPPVIATRHGKIGMLICFDLEFPEMVRGLFLDGADIIAVPTNWPAAPVPKGERPAELHDAMSAARLNRVFIACCDRSGRERGTSFVGASAFIGPEGWIRTERENRDIGEVVADIDVHEARDKATGPQCRWVELLPVDARRPSC